jgi:PHP family Zn ribbon phosphoesterase
LIISPSIETAEKITRRLARCGNLEADARPTFTFPAKELVKIAFDVSADCLVVSAHAWTPWFSVFGSKSGFDSLEECFEEETKNIRAVETGLSSDPATNRRLSALDRVALISNSHAHSPKKLGREANVLACALSYGEIIESLLSHDPVRFLFTVEFFPEEGKYHYDGHRKCGLVASPGEASRLKSLCPACGTPLAIGVLHRLTDLANRSLWRRSWPKPWESAPAPNSSRRNIGNSPNFLVRSWRSFLTPEEEALRRYATPRVSQGILNAREGRVQVKPGYDDVYGKISVLPLEEDASHAETSGPLPA